MARKGRITEPQGAGRVVSHGKITSLTGGFALRGGVPFSLYIRPKYSVSTLDTTLSVKCVQDEVSAEAPFAYNDWSPLCITEIAAGQENILDTCDLYWGSGEYVEQ